MITKEQRKAIEDYIETNFDGIYEMLEQYKIGVGRLVEKWDKLDDKLRDVLDVKLRQGANVTEKELDTLKEEWARAKAMYSMADGFILALLLQKINSKIFID